MFKQSSALMYRLVFAQDGRPAHTICHSAQLAQVDAESWGDSLMFDEIQLRRQHNPRSRSNYSRKTKFVIARQDVSPPQAAPCFYLFPCQF